GSVRGATAGPGERAGHERAEVRLVGRCRRRARDHDRAGARLVAVPGGAGRPLRRDPRRSQRVLRGNAPGARRTAPPLGSNPMTIMLEITVERTTGKFAAK